MEGHLLQDLVVLLGASLVVVYLSHLARVPPIIGFLVTGIVVGPQGLGFVQVVEDVQQLAEIGVILLLFTIGIEFSLGDLLRMRRALLVGGSIQVFGVTALAWGILQALGLGPREALFLGMMASLSSTAVVLRLLQQRAEVDAPHGRSSLAILVYQDLMIVPMILITPVLAGESGSIVGALWLFALKAVVVLVATIVLARFVVPQLLDLVVRTRSRDLFLLSVVTICLAVAWGASLAGLSLALGAFLAGLLVSESEYSHQALADIVPFRELFASFFFISIGMLLNVELAVGQPLFFLGVIASVLLLKALAAGAATLALGMSVHTAARTGLATSQVGEFSFVLAGTGVMAGIVSVPSYQWFVAAAVATMGVTPLLVIVGPKVASLLDRLPLPERIRLGTIREAPGEDDEPLRDHLIVIGYGVNGRNVARAASIAGIPFVVVDMNPNLVGMARAAGVPIHYGDATRPALLQHLEISKAKAVAVAISDAAATRQIVALARGLNPRCTIVARTRYVAEVETLVQLGATTVVPEELETSVEIVARLLASYFVPRREIETFIAEIRAGGYQMLRTPSGGASYPFDLRETLTDVEVSTLRVDEGSPLVGQRLADTDLRGVYGITVLAIRRGGDVRANPAGDAVVEAGDLLIVMGLGEEIAAAAELVAKAPDASAEA